MPRSVTLRAAAKVNLALEVLGRRPDGYHEVRTIAHTVSLYDELRLTLRRGEITLAVSGDQTAPLGGENLCVRAVALFRAAYGGPPGVDIALLKRIPPQSGLGGGSSDAAATLVGLHALTGLGSPDTLQHLAANLGSDAVLFLKGGATLCEGRGERVTPLRCPRTYQLAIARPDCSVSTAEAYGLLEQRHFTDGRRAVELCGLLAAGADPRTVGSALCNGFRQAVEERWPQIRRLVQRLLDGGAWGAEMTGSGSAVYGVFPDEASAERAVAFLRREGYWAAAARTVSRGWEILEETDDD